LDDTPDWEGARGDIAAIVQQEEYDENFENVAPILLRLAWHSSGTYCYQSRTGGSDGATIRFAPESEHRANVGLDIARDLLEPVKKKYPDISYADLYVLAGAVAVREMGGPKIGFRGGRSDVHPPCPELNGILSQDKRFSPDRRLPDAGRQAQHLRDIFYRMGFDDRAIVALSGAHAVGRCHRDRSGFEGPWTRSTTTFSNDYFCRMLEEKWKKKCWNGPVQFENKEQDLMMLPTDLALVVDDKFLVWVQKYAKDENLFFEDFARFYQELNELGCHHLQRPSWFAHVKSTFKNAFKYEDFEIGKFFL